MDREILFRGRRLDNGEWVEGSYMEHYYSSRFGCVSAIFTNDDVLCKTYRIPVDPSTVGQYTGLTDKNGKKIFEGDIIKTHYANAKKCDFVEQVVFDGGRFCGLYQRGGAKQWAPLPSGTPHIAQDKSVYMDWCEVIGSVHDNPELIGGEGDG